MKNWKIAILVSEFNSEITNNLLQCAVDELQSNGIDKKNIRIQKVPGAYELPFASKKYAKSKKYKAVICLGCIIKGETSHDVHIATWVSVGLGQVSLETGIPVMFGVLTPNSDEQAIERSKPGPLNRGAEVAHAAIRMIQFNAEKF